jgi:hypothetical protein
MNSSCRLKTVSATTASLQNHLNRAPYADQRDEPSKSRSPLGLFATIIIDWTCEIIANSAFMAHVWHFEYDRSIMGSADIQTHKRPKSRRGIDPVAKRRTDNHKPEATPRPHGFPEGVYSSVGPGPTEDDQREFALFCAKEALRIHRHYGRSVRRDRDHD